jgi:hypothetical protein
MSDIDLAQLIVSVALVVATIVYAIYTKRMATVLLKQLSWSKQPVIATSLEFIGPTVAQLRFENVGNGVASDIRAKISSEPDDLQFGWAFPSLLPRQSAAVFFPKGYDSMSKLLSLERLKFELDCIDIDGIHESRAAVLELGPFRRASDKTMTVYEESSDYRLEKQVEHISKIGEQLEKLVKVSESIDKKLKTGSI